MKIKKSFLFIGLLLSSVSMQSVYAHSEFIEGSSYLFDSVAKKYGAYPVINGAMVYQDEDNEQYTQGYRPQSSQTVNGAYTQETYDFKASHSALSVYENLKESLLGKGYDIAFECRGLDCGDSEAWQLYFSNLVAGPSHSQHYVVATLQSDNNDIAYRVAYINEFDNQARLILNSIDRIDIDSVTHASLANHNIKHWSKSPSTEFIGNVYFTSGRIDGFSNEKIQGIANKMGELEEGYVYLLAGYTDVKGKLSYNTELSLNRATVIKQALVSGYGVDEASVVTYGGGELAAKEAWKARKVSIYKLKIDNEDIDLEYANR